MPPEAELVEPLGQADAAALAALYAIWPESRFQTEPAAPGIPVRRHPRRRPARRRGRARPGRPRRRAGGGPGRPGGAGLAWARARRRGHRRPDRAPVRGRGRDVVLDVRESNLPALAAYARIGYRRHVTLLAGLAPPVDVGAE